MADRGLSTKSCSALESAGQRRHVGNIFSVGQRRPVRRPFLNFWLTRPLKDNTFISFRSAFIHDLKNEEENVFFVVLSQSRVWVALEGDFSSQSLKKGEKCFK